MARQRRHQTIDRFSRLAGNLDVMGGLTGPAPYSEKQLAGQVERRQMARQAKNRLSHRVKMKPDTPLEMLLDKAEEELSVWERNELEAEL